MLGGGGGGGEERGERRAGRKERGRRVKSMSCCQNFHCHKYAQRQLSQ